MDTTISLEGVANMLELSTAHITLNTSNFLAQIGNAKFPFACFRISNHEYGHILILSDLESHKEHLLQGDYEPCLDLVPVIEYALERNCRLIYLDSDATEITGLPSHQW